MQSLQPIRPVRVIDFLIVLFPLVLFGIHMSLVHAWIVDDAAITFAYARNAAQGYGLVSQPFAAPVEGYSNFTWLLTMIPFNVLGLFNPTLTPKLISAALIAVTYVVVFFTLRPLRYGQTATLIGLSLVSLNTSFVMWCSSGLENPLYVLLVTMLVFIASRQLTGERLTRTGFLAGIIAALAAMTRPDGLLYAAAFAPLILLMPPRQVTIKLRLIALVVFGVTAAALYGAFLLFRLTYFGELMPNTYTMKGGPGLEELIALITLQPEMVEKLEELFASVTGSWTTLVLVILFGATVLNIVLRQFSRPQFAILTFGLCALGIYMLLPYDWMEEFRFATVFFLMFYLYAAVTTAAVVSGLPALVAQPALVGVGAAAFLFGLTLFIPRSEAFAAAPTISMESVTERYAVRFEVYAENLGVEDASVLLPDVGGMLYYSDLRVYDAAGLTDRTIAKTLGTHINRKAFYNYVFEETKPTFIHTHGFWSAHTKLAQDERFAADYMPICEYQDPLYKKYFSGDYVRRDVAENEDAILQRLRVRLDDRCNLVDSEQYLAMVTQSK